MMMIAYRCRLGGGPAWERASKMLAVQTVQTQK